MFNYNPKTGRVGKGCLAEDTHDILKYNMWRILVEQHGIKTNFASDIIENVWTGIAPCVKPVCDVKKVFESLKELQIKIAICTSDDRMNTELGLDEIGVSHLADYILCGDDSHNVPKPAPDNVHHICERFGLVPTQTLVVGEFPRQIIQLPLDWLICARSRIKLCESKTLISRSRFSINQRMENKPAKISLVEEAADEMIISLCGRRQTEVQLAIKRLSRSATIVYGD